MFSMYYSEIWLDFFILSSEKCSFLHWETQGLILDDNGYEHKQELLVDFTDIINEFTVTYFPENYISMLFQYLYRLQYQPPYISSSVLIVYWSE